MTVCLGLAILGAACSNGAGKRDPDYRGDGTFGTEAPQIDRDAASEGNTQDDLDSGTSTSEQVKLRLFHGVLNLAGARFCHDPDYTADDPSTPEDEGDSGPEPPRPMLHDALDGGTLPLGVAEGYFMLAPQLTGAITVHRAPLPTDAGADAGGSNAFPDAARDAAALPSEAGIPDAGIDPCDPSSLEAVLPIPLTGAWLEPPRPPNPDGGDARPGDAGASDAALPDAAAASAPQRHGFVTTLSGDVPLTLFGSGLSLDPKMLALRQMKARDDYLRSHPGDPEGAEAAGRAVTAWLQSTLGPRFFLSPSIASTNTRTFALSFVHLIPDVVPSIDAGVPAEPGSGALHMCVRIDTMESELTDRGAARLEFRNAVSLGQLDWRAAYRFRVFVEADFMRTQANCGVTSLKPVAELLVPASSFVGGGSYTLVAWGARAASDLCTGAYSSDTAVRPGCARPADSLNAQIVVLENELPE